MFSYIYYFAFCFKNVPHLSQIFRRVNYPYCVSALYVIWHWLAGWLELWATMVVEKSSCGWLMVLEELRKTTINLNGRTNPWEEFRTVHVPNIKLS